jgi:GalNAc-alpha-(1->4)-GalNAc-alpha-(1->3)-diNAcBac-PP-undecaprenol alpha-1,4-N-acetyl-D-galactosaminyltransferase
LSQSFIARGHEVSVITLSNELNDFYKLPKEVHRVSLDVKSVSENLVAALQNNWIRLLKVRQAVCSVNPDVIISFLAETNVLTLVALTGTGYPVIVTEHTDPKVISCGSIWRKLRRLTYPYAAKVVSVSKLVDIYFQWLPNRKREVIYNPFLPVENSLSKLNSPKGADINKAWFVAMGRLSPEKGFDNLLAAFHQIADNHPNWQLLVLGEGELRSELEALRDRLGLSSQVIFPGAISNPFLILQRAKFFVSSSRSEAFPMSQGEALACGLPVISTDCGGPSEIIRDGIDGMLVPNHNVKALATAMAHLMSNSVAREQLAAHAPEVTQRFSIDAIMAQWETLIEESTGLHKTIPCSSLTKADTGFHNI